MKLFSTPPVLSGKKNKKRKKLLKRLDLPERMTANALLQAVNLFCIREELEDILRELE